MRKPRIYIETSVWNFLFADDAPDKMNDTILFFDELRSGDYELYISQMVLKEINRAPEPRKSKLLDKIKEYEPEELDITGEVDSLVLKYMEDGFMPLKAYEDLIHAAVASVNNMDFLVSWNLSHIVKVKNIMGINRVNVVEGYRELKISTVWGVLQNES